MGQARETTPSARRFAVHARHEGHHRGHVVEGRSFEEAAVAFVERWHPPFDAEGVISVLVTDEENGVEHCFSLDAHGGDAKPCA